MAWKMMLRTKSGSIEFRVRDPATDTVARIDLRDHLTHKQAFRVATRPDLIWQFAQYLSARYAARGIGPVEVYARSSVSLNGHPPAPLVDEDVDLAAVRWHLLWPNTWITPEPAAPR
jgi:hypothetical protein